MLFKIINLLFLIGLFFPDASFGATSLLTSEEKKWISEHPEINVRVSRNYPPFEFVEDGEFRGYAYDHLMAIGESFGLNFKPTPDMPWKEALRRLQNKNGVDLILLITHTKEREKYFKFTHNYISFPYVIFSKKDDASVDGFYSLRDKTIAVEKGFIEAEHLLRDMPDIELHEVETSADALRSVSLGQANAYFGNLAIGSYLTNKLGLTNLKIAVPAPYGNDDYAMAVRTDWPELVSILNKGLDGALTPKDHNDIRSKWFPIRYEYGITLVDVLKWVGIVSSILLVFIFQLKRMVRVRTEKLNEANEHLISDAHERNNLLEELNNSRELLKVIFDNSPIIGGLLSKEGLIEEVSQAALDFYDVKREDLIGKKLVDSTWFAEGTSYNEDLAAVLNEASKGRHIFQELSYINSDGNYIYFDLWVVPVFLGDKIDKYVVTSIEKTQIKKLQSEAIRNSQLATLGELSAAVAHEVNNPLGGVINYAEILKSRIDEEKSKDILDRIVKEGERISEIVQTLLSISRKEEKEQSICDFSEILKDPLSLITAQFKKDHIEIEINICDDLPPLKCNDQQLRQVFLNLLSNSRHALNDKAQKEEYSKKIIVSAESDNGYLLIKIEDNGKGISRENIEKIKEPFFTTKQRGVGTGLGMSISTDIISEHNGELIVESEEGKFTCITIKLPIK